MFFLLFLNIRCRFKVLSPCSAVAEDSSHLGNDIIQTGK
jgi:hypothetical protein